jgi:hypothetical protein
LALCQRYYFKHTGIVEGGGFVTSETAVDSLEGVHHNFPVQMRSTPTLTMLGTVGRGGANSNGQRVSINHFTFGRFLSGGGTANVFAYATGGFEVTAEL